MTGHSAHILAVDDDDRLRDLLKRYLVREGYDVTTARDAAAARRFLQNMAFDLIILDVMMPGEDGLSLLGSIRQTSMAPVILLTARGLPTERIEGLKLGRRRLSAQTLRARGACIANWRDPATRCARAAG